MALNALTVDAKRRKYVYFLYSTSQLDIRTNTDATLGKQFVPGEVLINGSWKQYTQISEKPANQFSDTIIIAQGYTDEMKYTQSKSIWRAMDV